jgi:ribosome-binding protein aMBF1 (putative translation factor)
VRRRPGRPRGSSDLHGKARRFDPRWDRDYLVAIGRRLHDARAERDVSASELGAACGLDASCIYKIERGDSNPLARTLCRLAVALGLSPSELMP